MLDTASFMTTSVKTATKNLSALPMESAIEECLLLQRQVTGEVFQPTPGRAN